MTWRRGGGALPLFWLSWAGHSLPLQPTIQTGPALCPYTLSSHSRKTDSGRGPLTPSDFLPFLFFKKGLKYSTQRAHGLKTPLIPLIPLETGVSSIYRLHPASLQP